MATRAQTEQTKKTTSAEPAAAIERKEGSAVPVRHASFTTPFGTRPYSLMRRMSEDIFDKGVLKVEVELALQGKPQGRVIEVREGKTN